MLKDINLANHTIGFFWCEVRRRWYVTWDNDEIESFGSSYELTKYLEILEKSLK